MPAPFGRRLEMRIIREKSSDAVHFLSQRIEAAHRIVQEMQLWWHGALPPRACCCVRAWRIFDKCRRPDDGLWRVSYKNVRNRQIARELLRVGLADRFLDPQGQLIQ